MTTAFQDNTLAFQFDPLAFQIDASTACVSGFQADAFQTVELAFQICANDIPVTPTSTEEGGHWWKYGEAFDIGVKLKGAKPKPRHRPLGDEFLRIQLEQIRLAGLIDENEEEELLVLLIATSMH